MRKRRHKNTARGSENMFNWAVFWRIESTIDVWPPRLLGMTRDDNTKLCWGNILRSCRLHEHFADDMTFIVCK